jgi:hypothetical protein
MINIDVSIGDTVLMGKFKNKSVIVKDIGIDDYGMPTINGKKACTFRIKKKENQSEGVKTMRLTRSQLREIVRKEIKEFRMSWERFFLKNGRIVDEDGYEVNKNFPSFKSAQEAQQYLEDRDIRGDVMGDWKKWRN